MDGEGAERAKKIHALRVDIGRIGRSMPPAHASSGSLRFGLAALDDRLPTGGLNKGCLHEFLGAGADTEHGTLPSLLAAGLLARHLPEQPVLWAMQRSDLFPAGLAGVGLHPDRLILAQAGRCVLAVMEEGLRHPGLAAVVGEVDGPVGLTASRRLQLAAEASGVPVLAIRRSRRFDDPILLAPSAAWSRWRVSALSAGGWTTVRRAVGPDASWCERASWRLELLRCRDSAPFQRIVRGCDDQGRLSDPVCRFVSDAGTPLRVPLAAVLADGQVAARYA